MEEAGWDGGWAGLFTITPDWHPVLDRVPGYDNVYVAAGFSGHGFKLSPAIGRALAELIANGEIDVHRHLTPAVHTIRRRRPIRVGLRKYRIRLIPPSRRPELPSWTS